ncbi:MAG: acyl-CoA dehydrogenase [Deltaproteobacteria bacterium]|nr:acyl-CoA dehydrogenase [Deltaproteobacteria bacterium]
MGEKFLSERNLKFLLYEVFDVTSLLQYPYYAEHSRETFDMVLETAMKIGMDLLRPKLEEMDRNPPEFVDGHVKVHPAVRTFMNEFGEGGWISAIAPMKLGGQQIPRMVDLIPNFIFAAANYSTSAYLILTTEAARLIESFGSEEMIETYIPKMFAGQWQGTMALTEPQAGSSLADIITSAEPTNQGYYKIRGQKIFISASEHDGVENVVNLLLAKIKGSPVGTRGISLFVVPNKRIDENGELIFNDVNVTGTYHKLGYRGCPINQLSLGENDDCRGYLVGEPNKGLAYMFQMMNASRLLIGLGAAAIASAAYYAALEYAKERPQGRRLTSKDPTLPQIPIIEHADVKRMLLFQRSIIEGSLSLLFQCNKYSDLQIVLEGEEKEKYSLLLDLLTPVAKSYPSEMGILSVSQALQCLGGYGYCDEFSLEQYYRDVRIHPIHEGTTGIHGITLLGRNVTMKNGKAFQLYLEEVQKVIRATEDDSELNPYSLELRNALEKLRDVTSHLIDVRNEGNTELFLADATLYLEFFGIIAIAWQWLLQALSVQKALKNKDGLSEADANFYQGKMYTFRYFFGYELPKIEGLAKRLLNTDGLTVEMKADLFSD